MAMSEPLAGVVFVLDLRRYGWVRPSKSADHRRAQGLIVVALE